MVLKLTSRALAVAMTLAMASLGAQAQWRGSATTPGGSGIAPSASGSGFFYGTAPTTSGTGSSYGGVYVAPASPGASITPVSTTPTLSGSTTPSYTGIPNSVLQIVKGAWSYQGYGYYSSGDGGGDMSSSGSWGAWGGTLYRVGNGLMVYQDPQGQQITFSQDVNPLLLAKASPAIAASWQSQIPFDIKGFVNGAVAGSVLSPYQLSMIGGSVSGPTTFIVGPSPYIGGISTTPIYGSTGGG